MSSIDASRCSACGSSQLHPHLQVAGIAGPRGLIPTTDRFGVALSDIVRCQICGHMQLAQFPPEQLLAEEYRLAESTDYLDEEPGQRATARLQLEQIERHMVRGRLLDVGCWAGFLLDEASLRGWETIGLEPSAFASRFAREQFGLDVRTSDLFAAELDSHSFHAVVLADVIEHLSDPGSALDRIAAVSSAEAVAQLVLPDAGSLVARGLGRRWWSVIPTHVQYFTRRSLAALLDRHGWTLLDLRTSPKAFTVRYYLGRTSGYSERLSRTLIALAGRAGLADRIWAPDFRDRMAVIARAPPRAM